MLFPIAFRPLQPIGRFMSHDLGDFPTHIELANPGGVVWLVEFVAVGCDVRLLWQIGSSQAQADGANEIEEQEPPPAPVGLWSRRMMHRLRLGKSGVLASGSNLDLHPVALRSAGSGQGRTRPPLQT